MVEKGGNRRDNSQSGKFQAFNMTDGSQNAASPNPTSKSSNKTTSGATKAKSG